MSNSFKQFCLTKWREELVARMDGILWYTQTRRYQTTSSLQYKCTSGWQTALGPVQTFGDYCIKCAWTSCARNFSEGVWFSVRLQMTGVYNRDGVVWRDLQDTAWFQQMMYTCCSGLIPWHNLNLSPCIQSTRQKKTTYKEHWYTAVKIGTVPKNLKS